MYLALQSHNSGVGQVHLQACMLASLVFDQLTLGSSSQKEGSAGTTWATGVPSDLQGSWLRAKEQTEYTRVH